MTEIMDEDKYIVLISEEELKNFCNESIKLSDLKHKGGRFYYKDTIYTGKVYSELKYSNLLIGNIKDGKLDGQWRKIDDMGDNEIAVYEEAHFKNNKRDGLYIRREWNNTIEKIGYYINGKKEGIWKEYNSYGELYGEMHYTKGKRVSWLNYSKNSMDAKYFYGQNKKEYFYKDGYLREEDILTEEGRVGRIYYKNGQLMAEGNNFEDFSWNIKIGTWNYYSEDGELKNIKTYYTCKKYSEIRNDREYINYEQYVNGIENGKGIIEETILKEEMKEMPKIIKEEIEEWIEGIRYVNGIPNPDTSKAIFKKMGKTGTFVEYHSNGKVAKEETYYDGKLNGVAKYWHDDGELYLIRRYSSGNIIDEAWEHNKNKVSTILKNIWNLAVEWAEKENMKRLNSKN